MGKGGKSYYALDLTDGNATTEAQAGAKLLWEFPTPDWKYTYGRPIIVKTYAYGWTVIVTSGYNNVSGEGRIYFLDPKTGKPQNPAQPDIDRLRQHPCGGGNPSGPGADQRVHQGLPQPVRRADLRWRPLRQHVALRLSEPEFGANLDGRQVRGADRSERHAQPVTTAPQIEIDFANGVDRYVFIGTGQLLDVSDLTTPAHAAAADDVRDPRRHARRRRLPDGDRLPITRGRALTPSPRAVRRSRRRARTAGCTTCRTARRRPPSGSSSTSRPT